MLGSRAELLHTIYQELKPLLIHCWFAFKATADQLIAILAVFAILGIILHLQERIITATLSRGFSPRAVIYSTGWLGVPIHETSHLLMALLFGHKIGRISFFKPDPTTGTLGYVEHNFDPENPYHLIGNFFIGIAPLLGGSLVMFLAYYFLLKDLSIINLGSDFYRHSSNLSFVAGTKKLAWTSALMLKNLFQPAHFKTWKFWGFLYLTFCTGAHMAPSLPDLRHSVYGFGVILVILFILNFIFSFLGGVPPSAIVTIKSFLAPLAGIMLLAIILNFLNILISLLLSFTLGRKGFF